MDNGLYPLKLKNERSRRQYKLQGRDSSRDSLDRDRKATISNGKNRSINKSRNNSSDRSDDRSELGRNQSRQKSTIHCDYCSQDDHTWKHFWEMQL